MYKPLPNSLTIKTSKVNCIKVQLLMTNHDDPAVKFDYKKWNLITIKDIQQGEELTLTYTFYNI